MSILDRIQKLVALAQSTNEHEARNAAVQACKLIAEHKVTLMMPEERSGNVPLRNVRTGGRPTRTADEVMRDGEPVDLADIFGAAFGKDTASYFRKHVAEKARQREAEDQYRNRPGQKAPVEKGPPYTMTAPQDGTCRACGEAFFRGDRIWYRRGRGAVHTMKCDPSILEG